jgi:EAL and modified HD-GYP domain-containing signal transduction protein
VAALDVVVGRQPIFDRHLSVFGYELLFRPMGPVTDTEAAGVRGDRMTADVLFGSVSIGVDRLVGDRLLFCNASRGVLTGTVPVLLPPGRTVIEVLESVVPDEEVLAGCRRLRDEGFMLALDDVTVLADVEPFIELASIVKVDVQAASPSDVPGVVERCHELGVTVVAEKVETVEELDRCTALGFDYFQGYLLARPCQVPGRALDAGRLGQLRLAAHLLDSECPISELESIVRSDPAMTLQLLQLAGMGGAKGMRKTVQTVREALVLVGWRRLQSWVLLLLIGGRGQASEDELTTALTRARMCELAVEAIDPTLTEAGFTAGMVSSFDVLLDMALPDVLRDLPLDEGLRRAVLEAEGPLGRVVADVADFQLGHPEVATRSGLGDAVLSTAALDALVWAVDMTTSLARRS